MVNLEELFQMEGVTAIARMDDMGRIVDWKAKGAVSPQLKEDFAKTIAGIIASLIQVAREAPRNWTPLHGFAFSGGDMMFIVVGKDAVIAETTKIKADKIFQAFGIFGHPK